MKPIGIVRKIDNLGRIVIPKEVRNIQGWAEGTSMEMYMEGNALILQKYETSCTLCGGNADSAILINSKYVCLKCCEKLGRV